MTDTLTGLLQGMSYGVIGVVAFGILTLCSIVFYEAIRLRDFWAGMAGCIGLTVGTLVLLAYYALVASI